MKARLLKFRMLRFVYWRAYSLPSYLRAASRLVKNQTFSASRFMGNHVLSVLRVTSSIPNRTIRWIYWRGVFLKNILRAALRSVKNVVLLLSRVIGNYSKLYSRVLARNLRVLLGMSQSFSSQIKSANSLSNATGRSERDVLSDPDIHPMAHFSMPNLLEFLKWRMSTNVNVTDEEIAQSWIEILQKVEQGDDSKSRFDLEANLILHVHYLDIAIEIIDLISSLKVRFRQIVITTTNQNTALFLQSAVNDIASERATIIPVDNSFRDARPFLIAIRSIDNRLPVLKLHTKKSPHLAPKEGEAWRRDLISGLIPSAESALMFTKWLGNESLPALICPAPWLSSKREWGRNDLHVFSLCSELGISMRRKAPFPKGTMFWINNEVVESMKSLSIPAFQEQSEKKWTDSTWAHGLERIMGQIVINGGRGYILKAQ